MIVVCIAVKYSHKTTRIKERIIKNGRIAEFRVILLFESKINARTENINAIKPLSSLQS